MGKDVYKCIKQNYAAGGKGQRVKKKEKKDGLKRKVKPDVFDGTCRELSNRNGICVK